MPLRAVDVFTPGAYPEHTYVPRNEERLEARLADALSVPGNLVSLSGPSKSGKTVLIEKVVGRDLLIPITGATVKEPADVWQQVLDWIDSPSQTALTEVHSKTLGGELDVSGEVGIPLVAKGQVTAKGSIESQAATTSTATKERRGLSQVLQEIGNSDFVILIDDFHYMSREVQADVAKSLKEAIRLGLKVVTAAVAHRGDDMLRANPELRGRVQTLDLKYWNVDELATIPSVGFGKLNASISDNMLEQFLRESAGSPQLMQSLCLQACFVGGLRSEHEGTFPLVLAFGQDSIKDVLEQTTTSTDYRSVVDVLDGGPPTRGTERKIYKFKDGTTGDVYRAILKALAINPPLLSFTYDTLQERIASVCNEEPPVGSSVISTCVQMQKLTTERFPKERVVDWDESKPVLDIPDPYFLFYLRWSNRLTSEQK